MNFSSRVVLRAHHGRQRQRRGRGREEGPSLHLYVSQDWPHSRLSGTWAATGYRVLRQYFKLFITPLSREAEEGWEAV